MPSTLPWPVEGSRRVPAWVYTDAANYALEQERIFGGRSWNYVGLTSEVPRPGDFLRTYVGETPVVVVRDHDSRIRVFVNRCTHRGSQFCLAARGNATAFTCPYHQWTFDLAGALKGVPFRRGIGGKGGMSECFDPAHHGLQQLAVAERNGVIFASHANDVEPLEDYLGPTILSYFDRVCDGRPLQVIGTMRHRVEANWKLQVENLKDTIHAALLHAFFVRFGIWRSDQSTEVKVSPRGRSSVLVSTASFRPVAAAADEAVTPEFDLEDKRIIAYQREFEHGTGAILTIWPNLIILQQLNLLAMRHVRPAGPNACIKSWTFFGYADDTPELRRKRLLQANLLGPSGLITIDDNEVLACAQAGAAASRGANSVLEAGDGSGDADHMMTESAIRGFYDYYRGIMEL
ncbi:MAG TPA: Rieske 2Fe-2S domain-containing protein [Stellaceae bacterium]|jgi:anthranilate 1,2-dioxygenase large subunit/salicylate 5-hydroxylase large subunit